MLETRLDTPDAYQPVTGIGIRSGVRSVEEMQEAIENDPWGYGQTEKIVAIEEQVLGVSATDNPDAFFEKHCDFLADSNMELNQSFERTKDRVVDLFSSYFGDGDETSTQQFKDMFNRRLDNITYVYVTDPLKDTQLGAFQEMSRTLNISGLAYFQVAAGSIDKKDILEDTLISHEIIHGMLTSARTEDIFKNDFFSLDGITRNGIVTRHAPNETVENASQLLLMHTWLLEGNIEDMRQRVLGTKAAGYKFGVAVLRTLKDLDPDLQDMLESASFGSEGPAELIGRLELLIGPTGVEEIDSAYQSIGQDQEKGKKFIQALLPENLRSRAGEAFDKHWGENEGVGDLLELDA